MEGDRANAKPYKHTDDCSTKSEWDSADFEMGCVGRGQLAIIIQKRSQCSTVTALFIIIALCNPAVLLSCG